MDDRIFIISPDSKEPTAVEAVSFSDLGVKERRDLQEWIIRNPGILGEDLLVITTEFAQFNKSSKRLDILALDRDGKLVVVELKLDAAGTWADLQAIRYAAFCSTMTMTDVIQALAKSDGCSDEEAGAKITEFLRREPGELDSHPRIILAAGSMDDQELTSCVLWLWKFGVNITCIELTPYRIPEGGRVILVPRIIIPLAEAKKYLVSVARKEATQSQESRQVTALAQFWKGLAKEFNNLGLPFKATGRSRSLYMQVRVGCGRIHYEWLIRKSESILQIALHCEQHDRAANLAIIEHLVPHEAEISAGIPLKFEIGPWGRKWAHAQLMLPYEGDLPNGALIPEAARVMKVFIERTWPILKGHVLKA